MVNGVVQYRGRISSCWSSCVVSAQVHCAPALGGNEKRWDFGRGGFFLAGYREEKAAVTMTVRIVLCWGENRKKTGCECARRTGVCGCVEYLLSVWRHKPEACFNTYVVNTLCNRTRYEVSSLPVWISSVTSVTPTAIKINKVFDLWLLIGPWTFSVLKSCINIHVSHSHTLLATVNMFRT